MVNLATKTSKTLYILMNGLLVGTLVKHSHGGLTFTYDPRWLEQPGARPNHWHTIKRRHFIATAMQVKFSRQKAEMILQNMLHQVEPVIKKITNRIPSDFPKEIANNIFKGMMHAKKMLT